MIHRTNHRDWHVRLHIKVLHDDVIKWKHFPRYWPLVRGIHRSPVNSPHQGQWRRALMFSLICTWINGWVNSGDIGDLRRHRAHYDVTVMGMIWKSLYLRAHQRSFVVSHFHSRKIIYYHISWMNIYAHCKRHYRMYCLKWNIYMTCNPTF